MGDGQTARIVVLGSPKESSAGVDDLQGMAAVKGAGQGLSSREGELDIPGSGWRRSQTHTLRGFEGHWRCLTS